MTLLWTQLIPAAVTAAWVRYRSVVADEQTEPSPSLTLTQPLPRHSWGTHRHQRGARWLHEIFERSAERFPELTALSVPDTGESLTYAQLNHQSDHVGAGGARGPLTSVPFQSNACEQIGPTRLTVVSA